MIAYEDKSEANPLTVIDERIVRDRKDLLEEKNINETRKLESKGHQFKADGKTLDIPNSFTY